MNKNAIQKFAIWARNELIAQVSQRAYQYGIDESGFGDASADTLNGRLLTAEEKSQRQELIKQIKEKGYKQVMEEVAYTWFNRFIALRFMEVNNYLPSHIRVFSDASGAFKPEILNDVLHLDLPGLDSGKVAEYIESNDTEALYRYLLLTQCNALNSALPVMFERMGGYTEMLLPNNILRQDSVLGHMVSDIPEEDWQDAVQIIGWLYQYYNTELKDDTFAQLKKNVKITKERIPAATQLFTPDWIVRYMVENSLGRLWLEGHPNAELRGGWKYYLDEADQEPEVEAQLAKLREEYKTIKPEEIKVIDPCMGSGHILVYAFDVLMQIYTSAGWDQREAAQSILKNNLFGLDIDDRAAQLAYFAVMMKARQYDRRLLTRGIQPNIYSIRESNGIQTMTIEYFHKNDPKLKADIESIVAEMRDAKEYGSILNITPVDFAGLYARFDEIRNDINMMQMSALDELLPLVKCAEVLAKKYDVVIMNPPYAGTKGLNAKLTEYLQEEFSDAKGDLFAAFIVKSSCFIKQHAYVGMVTPTSWLYNPAYAATRMREIERIELYNLVELGSNAFEVGFGTVMFVFSAKKKVSNYLGTYLDIKNKVTPDSEIAQLSTEPKFAVKMSYFREYEGCKFSYKLTEPYRKILRDSHPLSYYGNARAGLQTDDNARFIREWYEVAVIKIDFHHPKGARFGDEKWFPHIKGGTYRKWYGNLSSVVNWQYDGAEIKSNSAKRWGSYTKSVRSMNYYFCEGVAWTHTTYSQPFACRYIPVGVISNIEGPEIFDLGKNQLKVMGMLNSKVMDSIYMRMSDSIHYLAGELANFPIRISNDSYIDEIAAQNIKLAKENWDSFETSWDFKRNPLV